MTQIDDLQPIDDDGPKPTMGQPQQQTPARGADGYPMPSMGQQQPYIAQHGQPPPTNTVGYPGGSIAGAGPRRPGLLLPLVLLFGFLFVGGGLIFNGCRKVSPIDNGGSGGGGNVSASIEEITEDATRNYAASLAEAMDAIASAIEKGDLQNWEQLKNNVQAYTKEARMRSFGAIDKIDTESIPAGDWDQSQQAAVAKYLRRKATGHRNAAK